MRDLRFALTSTLFLLLAACAATESSPGEPSGAGAEATGSGIDQSASTPKEPGITETGESPDTKDETVTEDSVTETSDDGGDESVEYQLAVIDGAAVSPSDPAVQNYANALDDLEPKCRNPRESLGDFAVVAQELLANGGVQESLLSIMVNVNRSIPKRTPTTDCADIFSSYVVLRGGKA